MNITALVLTAIISLVSLTAYTQNTEVNTAITTDEIQQEETKTMLSAPDREQHHCQDRNHYRQPVDDPPDDGQSVKKHSSQQKHGRKLVPKIIGYSVSLRSPGVP